MGDEADAARATRRGEFLGESLKNSNKKPRWGYFGIAGPLCIGDDSLAPAAKKVAKNEDEETIKNIQIKPLRKGTAPDVYFHFEPPLAKGDPYKDPVTTIKMGQVWMLNEEKKFIPPGSVKVKLNKGIEYKEHKDTMKDPKAIYAKYKDFEFKRPILANPPKKGGGGVYTKGVLFGGDKDRLFPKHVPDEFDRARMMRKKEMEAHRAILETREKPFFLNASHGNGHFEKNSQIYHYPKTMPTHIPREEVAEEKNPDQLPFKPSGPTKKGVPYCLMGKLPEPMKDPVPGPAPRKAAADGDEKAPFRLGAPRHAMNPQPSVTTMARNMRAERPSSFARPTF